MSLLNLNLFRGKKALHVQLFFTHAFITEESLAQYSNLIVTIVRIAFTVAKTCLCEKLYEGFARFVRVAGQECENNCSIFSLFKCRKYDLDKFSITHIFLNICVWYVT